MAPITRWRQTPERHAAVMARKRIITRVMHGGGLYERIDRAWATNRDIEVVRNQVLAPIDRAVSMAVVSDLHVVRPGEREQQLIELLRDLEPDVIVMNGDFCEIGAPPDACGPVLDQISAPLGVWGTLGNWDHAHPVPDWSAFLGSHGVRLLRNAATELVDGLWLVGLDSALLGWPDLDVALANVPAGAFTIGLIHCPVLFDDVFDRVPLSIAGHTHGGQIRPLGLPPLYMPEGCGRYRSGWYRRESASMYVSRGIGCSSIPLRIGVRPELAMFDIRPRP